MLGRQLTKALESLKQAGIESENQAQAKEELEKLEAERQVKIELEKQTQALVERLERENAMLAQERTSLSEERDTWIQKHDGLMVECEMQKGTIADLNANIKVLMDASGALDEMSKQKSHRRFGILMVLYPNCSICKFC